MADLCASMGRLMLKSNRCDRFCYAPVFRSKLSVGPSIQAVPTPTFNKMYVIRIVHEPKTHKSQCYRYASNLMCMQANLLRTLGDKSAKQQIVSDRKV